MPMTRPIYRSFASDNNAGAHPQIMEALARANRDHTVGYGDDPFTAAAVERFRAHFGEKIDVYFVFNGTAANVLGLTCVTRPYHAVLCARSAHIQTDECGAPERFAGMKLLALDPVEGKLTLPVLEKALSGDRDEHHVQPRVLSITQATEVGTVYRLDELRTLSRFAKENDLLFHMDGARIANAAAALGVPLRALTTELGVDVLSFGGTKNGLLFGEAVVIFDPEASLDFKYVRKQGMQLASKMRFLAVQFERLLTDDLWLKNASHANRMARLLAEKARLIPGVEITREVEANAVFARLPRHAIAPLQAKSYFYVWDEVACEVRWMCHFDTTEADIDAFLALVRSAL